MAKVQLLAWIWAVIGVVALSALHFVAPISLAGYIVGGLYLAVSTFLLALGLRRRHAARFGPANATTTIRSILVGLVLGLVVTAFTDPIPVPLLVIVTAVALLLDGVDGWLARRFDAASELGARFDMEVDAFLMLVLSVYDGRILGWWVLAIGLMRYAYVAAGWALPWLRGQLPPRYWRKIVTAYNGIALTLAASGLVPLPVSIIVVAVALLLLVESFGRDVIWLFRCRRNPAVTT